MEPPPNHNTFPSPTTTLAACPDLKKVDGLEGVKVAGAAAGLAVSGAAKRRVGEKHGGR